MKIKGRQLLTIVIIIFAVIAVCILVKPKKTVPKYVFSYAENQDADYPTTKGGKYFAELVEKRTNGRIKILIQHSGERGTEAEVISQLKYGGIDFARVSLTELSDEIKMLRVLQMPYIYKDSEHMWRILDGRIGDDFLETLSEAELVGLSWYDAGARNIYTTDRPIRTPEDLEGMKIRIQNSDLMASMVECFGAEPVKKEYSEVYSLLERKEIQGAENNWPSYETMQHYEVAKYYTVNEHVRIPEVQVCSQHTWQKLSEEDRKIIQECAKESSVYQRELWKSQEEISRKLVIEQGIEAIELSEEEKKKFRQAIKPLYEKYCKDYMEIIEELMLQ